SPTPSQKDSSGDQRWTAPKRKPRTPGNWRTISAWGPIQWARNSSWVMPGLRRTRLMRLIMGSAPRRGLDHLQRDAVMNTQISGARTLVRYAVDIDRPRRRHGLGAQRHRSLP